MAKATKFIAALPDGSFATRSSQSKVYTFCVAVRDSYENALKVAGAHYDVDASNYKYYVRELNPATQVYAHSPSYLADIAKKIEGIASAKEFMAAEAARRVAYVEARKADGYYDRWGVLGWCSRHDLAIKLANSQGSSAHFAEAAICAVEIKA